MTREGSRLKRWLPLVVAFVLAGSLLVVPGSRPARADGSNVMFLEAMFPAFATNVVDGLNSTGKLGTVTEFNGAAAVPKESDFVGIDVVLVGSDQTDWGDPDGIGDALASFVDRGGRVVQMVFSLQCPPNPSGVGGRWVTEGYGAFDNTTRCGQSGANHRDFVRLDPTSPLLEGVTTFDGGADGFYNTVDVAAGATLVSTWATADDAPFEAWTAAHTGCVVGLNFFPPSSDAFPDFWDASTDGWILQANALNFDCGSTPPPPISTPTTEPPPIAVVEAPTPLVITPALTG